jgi:hypothetical protein
MKGLFSKRISLKIFLFALILLCCFNRVIASRTLSPVLVLREGSDGSINEWSGPAKFALYSNGTVITETSRETSEDGSSFIYYKTRLKPLQERSIITSLRVSSIVGSSKRMYGNGEGRTWELIYWNDKERGEITIIADLKNAPANVQDLIRKLENYPKHGQIYLDYKYIVMFHPSQERKGLKWPDSIKSIVFSKDFLNGTLPKEFLPGGKYYNFAAGGYEYKLDAAHALYLSDLLLKAKTNVVLIHGHAWYIELQPLPSLPRDSMWVEHPVK